LFYSNKGEVKKVEYKNNVEDGLVFSKNGLNNKAALQSRIKLKKEWNTIAA
jgi:hypothetical protein